MDQTAQSLFSAVKLEDYLYHLPDDAIAKYPLAERDRSRLLVYQKKSISHRHFRELPDLLPANSLLFFNNTKVIPARMLFRKETGAQIRAFPAAAPAAKQYYERGLIANQPVQLAMHDRKSKALER